MRYVTFYEHSSGVLHGKSVLASDSSAIELNTPTGYKAIDHPPDKMLDPMSQRVDTTTGLVVDYQPPAPSPDHEWDAATKRWSLNAAAQSKIDKRASALRQIAALEARQPRMLREIALGMLTSAEILRSIDVQITELRKDL